MEILNVVFSDNATSMLKGNVNRHNCRYWTDVNPHWVREHHTHHSEKLHVWLGIVRDLFILGHVLLTEISMLMCTKKCWNIKFIQLYPSSNYGNNSGEVWFQQDGVSLYNTMAFV